MYIVWIILGGAIATALAYWFTHTPEGLVVGGIVGIVLILLVHLGSRNRGSYEDIIRRH